MLLDYTAKDYLWESVCLYRDKIIQQYEEILGNKEFATTWIVHRLKNNAWYKDKIEVENTHKHELSLSELHKLRDSQAKGAT